MKKKDEVIILDCLNNNQDNSVTDLCKKINIAPKNFYAYLKKYKKSQLIAYNTISFKKRGYKKFYYLTKKGKRYLSLLQTLNLMKNE